MRTTKARPDLVWVIVLFVAAALIRLPFLWHVGFDDMFFHAWASKLLNHGLQHAYIGDPLPNYPPLYLYVLWVLAKFAHLFGIDPSGQTFITLQKSLNCLGDCATGWLIYLVARQQFSEKAGRYCLAFWLFNPYVIYDSAIWGQVDVFISLFSVLALYMAQRNRLIGSYLALTLGILFKAQMVIGLPFFLLYLLRKRGLRAQIVPLLCACGLTLLIMLPFVINGSWHTLVQQAYIDSAGYFPFLSANAQNAWWLVANPSEALSQANLDTRIIAFGLSAKTVGLIMFAIAYALAVWTQIKDHKNRPTIMATAAAFAYLAFYCLNTEMHERYMYPFFALWLLSAFWGIRKWTVYAVLSITQTVGLSLLIWVIPAITPLRFSSLYPSITYPLAYTNLYCLGLIALWLIFKVEQEPIPELAMSQPQ